MRRVTGITPKRGCPAPCGRRLSERKRMPAPANHSHHAFAEWRPPPLVTPSAKKCYYRQRIWNGAYRGKAMKKMKWSMEQQQMLQNKTMLGLLVKGATKFIRNLLRLVLHPINGARRITHKYLAEAIKENAKKYPKVACFSSDRSSAQLLMNGWYEIKELDFLALRVFPKLKSKAVCLDIGANIGTHALYFAQFFDKVIAIEPHPRTYQLLKINAKLASNVFPVNLGCSNVYQKVRAIEPITDASQAVIAKSPTISNDEFNSVEFDVDLLDNMEMVNTCEDIDFLKIDVENHELECLEGAVNLLNKHKPVVVCEILASNISNGANPAIEFLKKNHYEFIYELREIGFWKKDFKLALVDKIFHKNHSMVICSPYRLD